MQIATLSYGFLRNVQARGPSFEIMPEKIYSINAFTRDENAVY
jgi:hypothetical protein